MPVSVPPKPSRPGEAHTSGCTTVRTVALLLVKTGSVVDEVTLLVFVSVVGLAGGGTGKATGVVVPLVIAPGPRVAVAVPEHVPWVVEAETKVVPVGMV